MILDDEVVSAMLEEEELSDVLDTEVVPDTLDINGTVDVLKVLDVEDTEMMPEEAGEPDEILKTASTPLLDKAVFRTSFR